MKKELPIAQQKPDNSASPKSKVFLVDDHPLVREWLAQLVTREADLEVCGEADDAPEALEKILKLEPDIVIGDISLKSTHGLALVKDLKAQRPNVPILILSMHDESLYAERVLRAGALGYINKQESRDKILNAIRHVLRREVYVSEAMAARLVCKLVSGHPRFQKTAIERLTDRELEVFQLIGRGLGTRRVAEELHLGIKTVESYRARIKSKLKLSDGTHLLQQATQWVHGLGDM